MTRIRGSSLIFGSGCILTWVLTQFLLWGQGWRLCELDTQLGIWKSFPVSRTAVTGSSSAGVKEFFEYIERERARDIDHMVRWYLAIGPLLTKVEGLVIHTNTGRAPKLSAYYKYWENRIYEVLVRLILKNLQSFNSLVLGNVPLFQAETILTAPEIILHPNINEIDKLCVNCVRNCVEITKVRAGGRVALQEAPLWKAGPLGGGGRRLCLSPVSSQLLLCRPWMNSIPSALGAAELSPSLLPDPTRLLRASALLPFALLPPT
ncbi:Hypothetical predicted protein [Marmota monax]|uniref:Uncharacterized protein n=1 Tax=Marmota monax TaxID=9995 RepID=A0A5E4AL45_MARMO|nr:hypothetical protein GHT09_004379 [Marmota monax]VTJ57202.1 Hypothetical predicted protein [Marmota monax]